MGKPQNDAHCESLIDEKDGVIRDGCAKFLLVIRTYVHYQPAGIFDENAGIPLVDHDYWQVDGWSSDQRDEFETNMRDLVQDKFGYGRFWLYHNKTGTRDFWCDVWIDFVSRENAHLVICALNNPRKPNGGTEDFRDSCKRGGTHWIQGSAVDMILARKSVLGLDSRTRDTTDRGEQNFEQKVVLHEFGHYLGLQHRCQPLNPLNTNGKVAYCRGKSFAEQDDLMAVGDTLRAAHGQPFKHRLEWWHGFGAWGVEAHLATDRDKSPW